MEGQGVTEFTKEQQEVGARVTAQLVDYFGAKHGVAIHAIIAEQIDTISEGVSRVANFGMECAERNVSEEEFNATQAKVFGDFYVQVFALVADCVVRSREIKPDSAS